MFLKDKFDGLLAPVEVAAKAAPFTLDSLIAWLETMPSHEAYDWGRCDGYCLIGQYAAATGYAGLSYARYCALLAHSGTEDVFILVAFGGRSAVHTFGAALTRARAYRASGTK